MKEQKEVVLQYVNKDGYVIEQLLNMFHVSNNFIISLKNVINCLFTKYEMFLSSLRRQGYCGASNMLDELNGLKTFIFFFKKNLYVRHAHCFGH